MSPTNPPSYHLRSVVAHLPDQFKAVAFSPDGKVLASGSADHKVRMWEAASGKLLQTLDGHGNWVSSVAWSPDGKVLASGSKNQTVQLWEAVRGKLLRTLEGHGS